MPDVLQEFLNLDDELEAICKGLTTFLTVSDINSKSQCNLHTETSVFR